ncbi:glutamate--tRNA ligase [Veillonella magna]|uniref:Glutamate--tRNA ligase n=1 Tax=Veillonella magna TaxID=464322 RepID=A0ABS2GE56_9FIRM|nr:glutamate--tRNA ligase [Veillonella magna]MBM6823940.1 glutamate--tRNA ligase [Veillonella magna]MBM6912080.1 glutamate--tRNA ligase [Veillonella magna]
MSKMKVRFAPSPTGPFHIGGARSALFNWLLARREGGTFLLRIEDTDLVRSTRESEENIKAALKWLGMDWDEGIDVGGDNGPYRQTERLDIYKEVTDRLIAEGKAYYCYCTEEELEAERQAQLARGETPKYNGHCRHLTEEQRAAYEAEGRKPTVRLRVPLNETVAFDDMVRGHVSFESNGIGDFVIVKSDGIPVYNYAVVIDDHTMEVTHVIRAEEHLSNTPRQIVIYNALGWEVPTFGHISLIMGKDGKKMSKRHGATSVEQYKNLGYLPEAINNFLALMGWAPEGEQELFTTEELIKNFSMDRVAKNPAVFDIDKLNWINFNYMKKLTDEELYTLCLPSLQEAGYVSAQPDEAEKARLTMLCVCLKDHISYGAQIKEEAAMFFTDSISIDEEHRDDIKAVLAEESCPTVLAAFSDKLKAMDEVTPEQVKAAIKAIMKETKLKGKFVFMPIRVAITGQMHGPDLNYIVPLLGRDTVLARLASVDTLA